ncbi:MAG: hypothetical protein KGZ71_06120 [Desulfobulbaceae bacterium]|nr:hypothetical protein [Candidatus Kapabacteria bacterium]MBS4000039.1 hypothetical protein [Desulfobulbaceae bacterium]
MKRIALIILTLLIVIVVQSFGYTPLSKSNIEEIVPSTTRLVTDLSGNWEHSYNEVDWRAVKLPYSEESNRQSIYKRAVVLPEKLSESYSWQLFFLGIDHQIEVYWNDQFIGRYFGGLVPFEVKIPDRVIRGGTNSVKLVISPARSSTKMIRTQHLLARKIYTGVIREILLCGTPHVWISDIGLKTTFNDNMSLANIATKINVSAGNLKYLAVKKPENDSIGIISTNKEEYSVDVKVKSADEALLLNSERKVFTIESERTAIVPISFSLSNPNLWSPDNPYLYIAEITVYKGGIKIDDYTLNFGVKELVIVKDDNKPQILLNRQPFKIKGVGYIEDIANGGQTLFFKSMVEDIEMIKILGANFIRTKYSPPHPLFVNLCDRNGILLGIDLPIYDTPIPLLNMDEIQIYTLNIAKQFISVYDNHASVFSWIISDGVPESDNSNKSFYDKIIEVFRKNSNKLLAKIIPFGFSNVQTEGFDLIGLRDARMDNNLSEVVEEFAKLKKSAGGLPVFMSYGSLIQPFNHNGYSDPLSIESQSYKILNTFKIVNNNNGSGSLISNFNDYLQHNPLLIINGDDPYLNTAGLVDRDRNQRLTYSTVQAIFNDEKDPLLNAGSHRESTPISFIAVGLVLGILLILLVNRFRRFREYLLRSLLRPYNFYSDIRDQRIISSLQTILLGVLISLTVGIYLASIFYFYKDSFVFQYVLMLIIPSKALQIAFYKLIWMPEVTFVIISIISLGLAFLTAALIKGLSLVFRARVYFNDCNVLSFWAALPAILLLPISIILIRILAMSPATIWIFILLYLFTSTWTIARLLRSTSILFDVQTHRVYFAGLILFVLIIGVPLVFYQINNSILAYAQYFIQIFLS